MKQTFTATVWQEGDWYIAQCREIELASQGSNKQEALVIAIEAEVAHGLS